MDREQIAPEVWCRRAGPIQQRYESLGIPCRVMPDMPHVTSLQRLSRNAYVYLNFAARWPRNRAFCDELEAAARTFDLIHFNHEGLFLLMKALRRRVSHAAMTAHVRTLLPDNVFSRWQYRTLAGAADRTVFITENERDNVRHLNGTNPRGAVIYNIAVSPAATVVPHAAIPRDGRLKVAVLSNFAFIRGTDRLVEIAENLASRGRRDIVFVVAGDMTFRDSQPGELGRFARDGGTFADYVARRGVGDMFLFLGHVAAPEGVLRACDVLLKPSRDGAPWGRDILEAMAMGRPVISIGRYERFVETGKTGFLLPEYSPGAVGDLLLRLDADRELCRGLGMAAAARIAELCDGPSRARELLDLWRDAVDARREQAGT